MRDWLLILVPVAVAIYFILNPKEFSALGDWTLRFFQ
jgi:hypothetical protein